jgi:hypothetical protein
MEKAVYKMMKSALLFYCKLVADLKLLGYKINPYDPCVANKMINGQQMTICWYVDDLFIGHANPKVVTNLLNGLLLGMTWQIKSSMSLVAFAMIIFG